MNANVSDIFVKSSFRTIRIFECFSFTQKPMKLGEIADMISCPPSSTFALLRSLEAQGYISCDHSSRTFVPTLKAALLGAWINDSMISDGTILRLMIGLQAKTGATVVLGALSGLAVQYIHVQRSSAFPPNSEITAGSMRPLLRSAMGQVFLSAMPPEDVPPIIRRLNAEEAEPDKWVKQQDIMERLARFRDEGYAHSEGAATKGAAMIAVLLATPPHQPPLGLGVGGPISFIRANKAAIVKALRAVVARRRQTMERQWGQQQLKATETNRK